MATNKCILIGNLTAEPEQSQTVAGVSCCKFTIAVARNAKNNNGGRDTDFVPIVAWRVLAENCSRFLRKGNRVCVVGELQIDPYTDKDGRKRISVKVNASEVEFLFTKAENENIVAEAPPQFASETPAFEEIPRDDALPF